MPDVTTCKTDLISFWSDLDALLKKVTIEMFKLKYPTSIPFSTIERLSFTGSYYTVGEPRPISENTFKTFQNQASLYLTFFNTRDLKELSELYKYQKGFSQIVDNLKGINPTGDAAQALYKEYNSYDWDACFKEANLLPIDINQPCKDLILSAYRLFYAYLERIEGNNYADNRVKELVQEVASRVEAIDTLTNTELEQEATLNLIPLLKRAWNQTEDEGAKRQLDVWLNALKSVTWAEVCKEPEKKEGDEDKSSNPAIDLNKPCQVLIQEVAKGLDDYLKSNLHGIDKEDILTVYKGIVNEILYLINKRVETKEGENIPYVQIKDKLIELIGKLKAIQEGKTLRNINSITKLNIWLQVLTNKDWVKCEEEANEVKQLNIERAKCLNKVKAIRARFSSIREVGAVQTDEDSKSLAEIIEALDKALEKGITSADTETQGLLTAALAELSQVAEECKEADKQVSQYKKTGTLNPVVPEPTVPSANSPQARSDICTKPSGDRWGVKFKYIVNSSTSGSGSCNNVFGPDNQLATRHEWFLTLLPAMRSVIPLSGGMDTPGALPGLQFQIRSNIAKHKVPGFQPIFQHMGVDSIVITLVGTFTGDGGLGGIYSVGNNSDESKEGAKEGENGGNQQLVRYEPWASARNTNPLSSETAINPLWNKTIPTHNRALRPATSFSKETGATRSEWNPYNSPNAGWKNGVDPNAFTSSADIPWDNPDIYMTKNLLRAGMFDRDGCPGTCPNPTIEDDSYSMVTGALNIKQEQRLIGLDKDVASAYTLRELSAYLDAYHEFTSFYKIAIHESRELEVEINLRKNNDGLNPQVNHFPLYARSALGMLRNDNGNPSFKGIVRDLRVYQARSDRAWYMMDIEVSDYGMAGTTPINLTNDLEERTKQALETLEKNRQASGVNTTINDSEECGKAILTKGKYVKFPLWGKELGVIESYFIIDIDTGYSTYAYMDNRGDMKYKVDNIIGGTITDAKLTIKHLLTQVNSRFTDIEEKKGLRLIVDALDINYKIDANNQDYEGKAKDSLTLYTLRTGTHYLDKDAGIGLKIDRWLSSGFEILPAKEIFETILDELSTNWQEDMLSVTLHPNIIITPSSTATVPTECGSSMQSFTAGSSSSITTSNPTGGSSTPPTSTSSKPSASSKYSEEIIVDFTKLSNIVQIELPDDSQLRIDKLSGLGYKLYRREGANYPNQHKRLMTQNDLLSFIFIYLDWYDDERTILKAKRLLRETIHNFLVNGQYTFVPTTSHNKLIEEFNPIKTLNTDTIRSLLNQTTDINKRVDNYLTLKDKL